MRWVMRHLPALAPPRSSWRCSRSPRCARPGTGRPKEKVESALRTLGAEPDAPISKLRGPQPRHWQLSQQVLILVPVPDGAGYKIVGRAGEIFDDYDDFLRDNTLPDLPVPAEPSRAKLSQAEPS